MNAPESAVLAEAFDAQSFGEFIDATVPWDDGTFAMLRAYFDASKLRTGVFTVAGIAFGADRAKKADRAWGPAFDGRRMHMTDLHARQGAFLGVDSTLAGRYCREAVRIINDHASFIVAVSCDVDEIERLLPKGPDFDDQEVTDSVRSAYNSCLHLAMMQLGSLLPEGERVQYWFERGDEFQGVARRFLARLNDPNLEPLRRSYRYGSDAFVSKADAPLFETADLVAWEWGKQRERVLKGQHERPSLVALLGGNSVLYGQNQPYYRSFNRYANHYSGMPLERFFSKMKRIMLATSKDEVLAIAQERVQ